MEHNNEDPRLTKRIAVLLTEADYEELRELAHQQRRKMSDIARTCITEYLSNEVTDHA